MRIRVAAALVTAVTLAGLAQAQFAHASVIPAGHWSFTANTLLVNRDDGGNGSPDPYWAKDKLRRTAILRETGSAPKSDCGGKGSCYGYSLALGDVGSFDTIPGRQTPNQSGPYAGETEQGAVTGHVAGSLEFGQFYSTSLPQGGPNAGVPTLVNGDTPSTGDWPWLFFAPGTKLYQGGSQVNENTISEPYWGWAYAWGTQSWVDASWNNYGDNPGDGNIIG